MKVTKTYVLTTLPTDPTLPAGDGVGEMGDGVPVVVRELQFGW